MPIKKSNENRINTITSKLKSTFVYVTHDQVEAMSMADDSYNEQRR